MIRSRELRIGLVLLVVFVLPLINLYSGSALASTASKSFKILAIGNSFSQDAMEHLYQIAAAGGAEEIVVANLYIGGCSLEVHWSNAKHNLTRYRYDKNVDGKWTSENYKTLLYGLQDEDWDVITLQQVSGLSGIPSSFTYRDVLQNLIDYVNEHKTNPDAKLAWHMTWAYQADSTHSSFALYDRDQFTMFVSIVNAVRKEILPNGAFDLIIPSGTAIQNVRTSYIGDTLTRDGYHLSYNLGRYIAGLTWFHSITGWPIDDITYVPNGAEIPKHYLTVIREAVKAAVENPFAVTISSYVDRPESSELDEPQINDDDYTLLDWEPVGCAYWNSRNSDGLSTTLISKENSNARNLCYFVSSGRMFTREDIPVGSIIEVDEGYQYRPEGWVKLEKHSNREPAVSARQVVVTEEWWGDYQYRAFNVSFIGNSTDISNAVEETAARFRIYVPK